MENSITYIYKMDKYQRNPGGFERQKENDGFKFDVGDDRLQIPLHT